MQEARPKAHDIYDRVVDNARDELARPVSGLAFSGVFAGLTMGLSALGVAGLMRLGASEALAALLYPIGFIAVIIGRAQLFTENTLYPVVLALEEHRHVWKTARLWVVVLAANLVGATIFALLAVHTGALSAAYQDDLVALGTKAMAGDFWQNFWSAVVAGWIIALVAWMVEASDATMGRVAVIGALTYVVGVGAFDHAIASACESLSTMVAGEGDTGRFLWWLAAIVCGNIAGGVVIVSLLNYAQVRAPGGGGR